MLKKKKIQRRPKATYYQIIPYKKTLQEKEIKHTFLKNSREQSSMSPLGLQHSKARVRESFKKPDACRSNDLEVIDIDQKMQATTILRDRRPREASTEKGRETHKTRKFPDEAVPG
jgi:hypothetical protein